jgi:hypothetical protein
MTAAEHYANKRAAQAAQATTTEIPRDRWGRPLIIPPSGGDPEPYTRVSTLAKALDDLNQLMAWKQRKTAEGLVRRPDLLTRIAGALANGDPDTDWPTKRDLNAVCEQAVEAAGASKGSSAGTGLHALTEAIDRGEEPLFVPDADRVRLDAYRKATAAYTATHSEVFVVCDALKVAGTFDRLWFCPPDAPTKYGPLPGPAVRVGDLKTGKSEADYPLATSMQLAIYAHGEFYDPATGQRQPLDEHLDLTTGLLIHMPAKGGCDVIPLDLEKGWRAAQLAHEVHHNVRKWKAADIIRGGAA